MKTKINELEKIAIVNQLACQAAIQGQHECEGTFPDILIEIDKEHFLKEREKDNYTTILKKRLKLAKRLQAMINDAYGGKMRLVQSVDEWIKLVSLNTEAENRAGNQEYSDLLFFLFTFKEMLQTSGTSQNLIDKSLAFIYGLFDRKYLIKDIDKWIRFVTLCTEKENYTGSEEYLALLNFFFIFKDALQNKKSQ